MVRIIPTQARNRLPLTLLSTPTIAGRCSGQTAKAKTQGHSSKGFAQVIRITVRATIRNTTVITAGSS